MSLDFPTPNPSPPNPLTPNPYTHRLCRWRGRGGVAVTLPAGPKRANRGDALAPASTPSHGRCPRRRPHGEPRPAAKACRRLNKGRNSSEGTRGKHNTVPPPCLPPNTKHKARSFLRVQTLRKHVSAWKSRNHLSPSGTCSTISESLT